MASDRPTLKVAERSEFGSRTTRRLRRDGQVPGVVYTSGEDARAFQADAHDLGLFIADQATFTPGDDMLLDFRPFFAVARASGLAVNLLTHGLPPACMPRPPD